MAYRDYSFYAKLFRRWRRKYGGAIRSRDYEGTRGYLQTSNDTTSNTGAKKNSGIWHLEEIYAAKVSFVPAGEHVYNTSGTYTWTCPAGVTSVSVVCVGGGGAGLGYFSSGGAGGGLAYKNNIPVVPGQSYIVTVGAGGVGIADSVGRTASAGSIPLGNGGSSSFSNGSLTVTATGGQHGYGLSGSASYPVGGSPSGTYDGGGTGGTSEGNYSTQPSGWDGGYASSGGGGAGGYAGNGGKGAGSQSSNGTYVPPTAGTGGGGGGGAGMATATGTANYGGSGGGGVGLYGLGTSGAAGTGDSTSASPASTMGGVGGSGGARGNFPPNTNDGGSGGVYGGGGGSGNGDSITSVGGSGGNGAVRIVWGDNRLFPSTNVDEASSNSNISTN